jgi:signal recognition particle subunit SRP54
MEGRFTLEDFLAQLQQVKKLGSLGGLLSLMPGVPKEIKQNAAIDDGQVAQVEAIIRSMTPDERGEPGVIDGSRRTRIARGSGTTTQEVNQLLKQFKEAQQLMRSPGMLGGMLGGGRGKLAQALAERAGDAGGAGSSGVGDAGPGVFGAGVLGDAVRGGGGSFPDPGGSGTPGAKGKGRTGAKKKKGGRVTPKSGGGGRGR